MHIKFLPHGTGNPVSAADYLLGTHDHNGIERAKVQVLRGDPRMVAQLAASMKTVHRYTSGVIAWHPDDEPTETEIDAFLLDFERTAFAGLKPEQYAFSAILHVEQDGSQHVHVLVPRVELSTGKAMNIAPPGWEGTFDALRDAWNYSMSWARPDDPLRSRLGQSRQLAIPTKPGRDCAAEDRAQLSEPDAAMTELRSVLAVEPDARKVLIDWLTANVCAGRINTRAQLLESLVSVGQITRLSDKYISIRLAAGKKPIRLRGGIFEVDFDAAAVRSSSQSSAKAPKGRVEPNLTAASAARIDLAAASGRRAAYNAKRYTTPLARRKAEAEPTSCVRTDAIAGTRSKARTTRRVAGSNGSAPGRLPPKNLLEDENDRTGRIALEAAQIARKAANNAVRRLVSASRESIFALERIEHASRSAGVAGAILEQAGRAVSTARTLEVDRFRSEISFPEFAHSLGYEPVKSESTRRCLVMRKHTDKIVVATTEGGHGRYYSCHVQEDFGDVSDFARTRLGGNPTRIRSELTKWLSDPSRQRPQHRTPRELPDRPLPVELERAALMARWAGTARYQQAYLNEQRGLDVDLIALWRVRQDDQGAAAFAHYDTQGLCGWESTAANFNGFAAGATRGLGLVMLDPGPVRRMLVANSSIDTLSWAQLNRLPPSTAFVSLAGTLSDGQLKLLQVAMARTGAGELVLATDADDFGDTMADRIGRAAPPGVLAIRSRPDHPHRNWNDLLRASVGGEMDVDRHHRRQQTLRRERS